MVITLTRTPLQKGENEKIAIEKRTIDFIATGEQQPETDHDMKMEHSESGNSNNEFYREGKQRVVFSVMI